jgi:Uma2 family endonuclease
MAMSLTLDSPQRLAELASGQRMSREEYRRFCELNPKLRAERSKEGVVTVLPPAGARTGNKNSYVAAQLTIWSMQSGSGEPFDSSTGFDLPDGSNKSPDAAWVCNERLPLLVYDERDGYAQICPDFVIELRSATDSLSKAQQKMTEWIANDARLGWLIDPLEKRIWIYRPQRPAELLDQPATVSGDPELPGFTLQFERIWNTRF